MQWQVEKYGLTQCLRLQCACAFGENRSKKLQPLELPIKIQRVYCSTFLIDSGAMHNFMSVALVQAMKATTINAEPICMTLGNTFKVLSAKLVKLSISFASKATQMVWCHIVPKLSAPIILGMDWLIQINPKTNCSEKTIKQTSNDMNVFLEACGLGRMHNSVGQLNLIGEQQINNMVCTTKGKNQHAWVIQCSMHNKLNAAELENLRCPNNMYLCSDIGVWQTLHI